jgi:hypothetical protein
MKPVQGVTSISLRREVRLHLAGVDPVCREIRSLLIKTILLAESRCQDRMPILKLSPRSIWRRLFNTCSSMARWLVMLGATCPIGSCST